MLHWSLESETVNPMLKAGLPPDGLLSEAEYARYRTLRTLKRRRDWLLGRWTAKHLVQTLCLDHDGRPPALASITVANHASGAVYLPGYPRLHLSISHSFGRAFCAVSDDMVGADIERITPRIPGFAQDYFTEDECRAVDEAADPDTLITAIWSAKEAGLKALGKGLTVDTRDLVCKGRPPANAWTQFMLVPASDTLCPLPLSGRWCISDGFVLSMVTTYLS